MKIIFFGDMAIPDNDTYMKLNKMVLDNELFKGKIVVGNLEGLIVNEENATKKYPTQLFNIKKTLDLFENSRYTVLTLANNHIKDIPEKYTDTLSELKNKNIGYTGVGNSPKEARKPHEFIIDNKKYAVFSHCWNVMSKIIEKKNNEIHINDMKYDELIKEIKEYKDMHEDTEIIVFLHWNFDFEELPFPSHRLIAKKLIDNGARYVIGGHSHVINGGEKYKDGVIVYGMGNFCIPGNKFLRGSLNYSNEATKQIIIEIDEEVNDISYYYIDDKEITKEKFDNGKIIKKYSTYEEMDEKEYIKFFKKNRTKKLIIPIYKNEKNSLSNWIKDIIVVNRMRLFRTLKNIK